MRYFRMSEIRFTQTIFILSFLSILFFSVSTPAKAQYYLVDYKHESSCDAYQNIENSYVSGVSASLDENTADPTMSGITSMFFSIAGACVGLPLIAMFALRILLGCGVKSATIKQNHFADLYLDAPPQPSRWYDPHRKSLSESLAK